MDPHRPPPRGRTDPIRLPHVILQTLETRLRLLILRLESLTRNEIYSILILIQRELFELIDFYTNDGHPIANGF
jgi:hypothetical protein